LFRAPVHLYHWRLGWLLTTRMLLLRHTGRVTGEERETVLEVIDRIDGAPVVCSGFGSRSDWLLNVTSDPDVSVVWSTMDFPARARRLDLEEATAVFERYQVKHRVAAKTIGSALGLSLDDVSEAARSLPVLVFERVAAAG
jgi:deazaflavin-dependent oxidoreductase (nitroreductase family)